MLTFLMDNAANPITVTPSFEEFTLVSLDGIVSLLKQAIPIATIYNLSGNKKVLDLIIVTEKTCCKPLVNFENLIDMGLLGYQDSVCTIHTFGYLRQQINNGHLFYSAMCVDENIIYRKSTAEQLLSPNPQAYWDKRDGFNKLFQVDMRKACAFYEGALVYLRDNRCEMAVFMLQQAVELTYKCFLNLLKGKDIKCHALGILRKNVRRYAPKLIGVFSEKEEEELFYLDFLEKGYADARYDREYTADKELVKCISQKVWALHNRAFEVFAQLMLRMDREMLKVSASTGQSA